MDEDEIYINYLKNKIKNKENIGNDLIEIFSNEDLINKIHLLAKKEILKVIKKEISICLIDTDIVLISLSIVGLKKYDGNFYQHLENETYSDLYLYYNSQRIEGIIRSILSLYNGEKNNDHRVITIALKNSIVPKYYLKNFFEFIFDIYKINFEYNIENENLFEEFELIFEGLKESLLKDTDELNINVSKKTYKLIKSTKSLIINDNSKDNLIEFSIKIIQIVDDYYWDRYNQYLKNQYYKSGFSEWVEENNEKEDLKHHKNEFIKSENRWIPRLKLIDDNIYLFMPDHKIKNTYNYKELKIEIYNDDKLIYSNNKPIVKELIGEYLISNGYPVKLNCPLGKITYKVLCLEKVIYNSKDQLYRKFIIFNEDGNEIHSEKNYNGNIYICHKNKISKVDDYIKTENYLLGNTYVNNESIIKIDDEYIKFTDNLKPDTYGKTYEKTFLIVNGEKLKVFQEEPTIIFSTDLECSEIGIRINGKNKKLVDLEYEIKKIYYKNQYSIKLKLTESKIYNVEIFEIKDNRVIKDCTFNFVIDKLLSYKTMKIGDDTYFLSIKSSLNVEKKCYMINIKKFDEFIVKVNQSYVYDLNLNIPIFKLGENYYSINDYIWIDDIKDDSKLYFKGFEANNIEIQDERGKVLTNGLIYQENDNLYIPLGFLRTYKDSKNYTRILFKKNNILVKYLDVLNKCKLNQRNTKYIFDSKTGYLDINISYLGKGNVLLNIYDNGVKIFTKTNINSDHKFKLENLKSFNEYEFEIIEEKDDFMMPETNVLDKRKLSLYAFRDFVTNEKNKKYFFISTARIDKGGENDPTVSLRRTFLEINEYIGNNKFIGNIYCYYYFEKKYLSKINPVTIEFVTDIIDKQVEAYITTADGDEVLIDYINNSILNKNFDMKADGIYTVTLDIEKKV